MVTLLLVLMNQLNYATNLKALTIVLCNLTSLGGAIFYTAHMLHESGRSEISTAGASCIFAALGMLISAVFTFIFMNSSIMVFLVLAILTVLTIGLAH